MKIIRNVLWLLGVILSGYIVAWTFGLFVLAPLFLFFILTGRIRIRGYWNLVRSALSGRLMILLNHPTLFFETFGIAALLFPLYLVVPWCFVWSMPDRRLLDLWKMPGWVRTMLRCVSVDRTRRMVRGRGRMHANKVLRARFILVGHPERGRTFGEANREKIPLTWDGRVMQKIESHLAQVAYDTGAWILPGWVQVPYNDPVSFMTSFWRMFGKKNACYRPVVYSFRRQTYQEKAPFDLADANARLQSKIFQA